MYIYNKVKLRGIRVNSDVIVGETIEQKVERMISNKEPIKDGAPLVYTDRNDGVQGAYNIRTDRFEVAADYMDKLHKSKTAKRDFKGGEVIDINKGNDNDSDSGSDDVVGGTKSVDAT